MNKYILFLKLFLYVFSMHYFQHYQNDADGLCTQLTKCLPKDDTKAFVDAGWVIQEHELQVKF